MDPGSIEDLSDQASMRLRRGDHVRALALADQLVAALPDQPVVHAIRARRWARAAGGGGGWVWWEGKGSNR